MDTLRDGRTVELRPAAPADAAALESLCAGDRRPRDLAGAHVTLAFLDGEAEPAACAAWSDDGEFACAVSTAVSGIGLGTLLLRRAAEEARASGLQTLSVELPEGAHALAAMLRDCGLVSFWDLDHPIGRVVLSLGARRPGWTTP